MKTHNEKMKLSALAFAMQGALIAMYAMPVHADDAADNAAKSVEAMRHPTNTIEVGVDVVSEKSAKFSEYNGLDKSGGSFVGNFNVRGGDAYDSNTGTHRWDISGKNLGLTSREIGGSVSNQGTWSVGFGYDELQHNTTTGYQTPYVGNMGGNNFVLPAAFGTTGNTTALTAPQKDFITSNIVDVSNTRKNSSINGKVFLNPEFKITFGYNQLKQSGAKLQGIGLDGHATTAAGANVNLTTGASQKALVLPMPTNYTTDTFDLGLHWAGEKANLSASYYGSFFKDNYQIMAVQNYFTSTTALPIGATMIDNMTTAPDNQFQKLDVTGSYALSKETKLAGGLSFSHNTQDQAFVNSELSTAAAFRALGVQDPMLRGNANGKVDTTHADLKLTNQTTKDLKLAVGAKYDKRDNKTPSNMYDFNAISWNGVDGVFGNHAIYPNTPLSNSKAQLELAADYRLNARQDIRVAYNYEQVKRWCNNYAVSDPTIISTAQGYYPAGSNCVVATEHKDNKLSADYKAQMSDDVSLRAGYSYSDRNTTSDPLARASIGVVTITTTQGVQQRGLNAGDQYGFYPFFDASRTQQLLKGAVNWQAKDQLNVGLSARYGEDKYDSTYGVQKGDQWSLNLDATYAYSDSGSITPFLTLMHNQRDMTNLSSATTVPMNVFSNEFRDDNTTFGLGVKQGDLLGGKLELAGNLTYSHGNTSYNTQYVTGVAATVAACATAAVMTCGSTPAISNDMTSLNLNGNYKLDKQRKVAFGYTFQKLKSDDYYFNGYSLVYPVANLLASNQQSGSYSINAVSVTYVASF